ncbi:MAG: hypothetical protein PHO02_06950 [Candidatus Nanoarchaeia archaeon]|nr:hypothetical protein [Candidatus Nanoarchaeia archaeon]
MDWSIVVIIGIFLVYYITIFIEQRKLLTEPKDIISKFLVVVLFYAGLSLIYYSIVGRPLLTESPQTYNAYIFIIGFIAIIWTLPLILKDFRFYNRLFAKTKETNLKLKSKRNSDK